MAKNQKQNLSSKLQSFLDDLTKQKGRSQKTRKNYSFYLARFLNHGQIKEARQINEEKIKAYRQWLNKQGLKRNTINYHLIALRSFLNYLETKGVKTIEPKKVNLLRQERFKRQALTEAETTKLLSAPNNSKEKEIIKLRDKAILETLEASNLKVSQLITLKRNNWQKDNKNQHRNIKLSHQAKHHLKKYLDKRMDSSPFLFISHDRANGKKQLNLTARSIQRIIKKYLKLAKIHKEITPESFRQPLKNN